MAIALSTLRNNCYTTMYNHLNTGTYAISKPHIYPEFATNQIHAKGYPNYTLKVEINKKTIKSFARYIKDIEVAFIITVRDNSAINLRTRLDELDDKITTGLQVFNAVGLKIIANDYLAEDYDVFYGVKGEVMHQATATYRFRYVEGAN